MSTFLHYVLCKDALLDCSAPGGERCESLTWVDEIVHTNVNVSMTWPYWKTSLWIWSSCRSRTHGSRCCAVALRNQTPSDKENNGWPTFIRFPKHCLLNQINACNSMCMLLNILALLPQSIQHAGCWWTGAYTAPVHLQPSWWRLGQSAFVCAQTRVSHQRFVVFRTNGFIFLPPRGRVTFTITRYVFMVQNGRRFCLWKPNMTHNRLWEMSISLLVVLAFEPYGCVQYVFWVDNFVHS